MKRGISETFLGAMREKLQKGREQGLVGWDRHWLNTSFPTCSPSRYLLERLMGEVIELTVALETGSLEQIKYEAADVANLAMMIADYRGSLRDHTCKKGG